MKTILKHMRVFLSILLFFQHTGAASTPPVLVVYPEAPEPYRQAFEQLMTGMTDALEVPLHRQKITAATRWTTLHDELAREPTDTIVVLLGQHAFNLYQQGPSTSRTVLVGGLNALPGQIALPGISLTIDPTLYLHRLHTLLPDIQQVIVFYHAQEQPWMVQVQSAAAAAGIRVDGRAIADAMDAVRQLGATLPTLDAQTTAVWFGRNTLTLDTELMYPYVLEQSWERRIAVFSDTIAHVRRGFLFALYPDYTAVGAELGHQVQQIRQGTRSAHIGLQFTRAAQFTLNARTARHLGLFLRDDLLQRAQPLFPPP